MRQQWPTVQIKGSQSIILDSPHMSMGDRWGHRTRRGTQSGSILRSVSHAQYDTPCPGFVWDSSAMGCRYSDRSMFTISRPALDGEEGRGKQRSYGVGCHLAQVSPGCSAIISYRRSLPAVSQC